MASTADNWGLYPTGCGSCSNSDRYESRLRLARLDVDKEKLDWYYEQEKWFGQSTAIAYGDWGTNDIFLGGAFDNKKTKNKADLVEEVRRVIRASIGNRAKESLVVDFINQTDIDQIGDKASVIEAFFAFAQAEQQREAEELINSENLNLEAARRYITTSLKREYASDAGTELNAILPKMSPLNPQYLTKKQSVFQKIAAFVEKFKGVGGSI